jgi:hypothetical protein
MSLYRIINQIIRRTDSIPDRQTYTVSDTPLEDALNAEGSYWFTEPDNPNEASIRSYVRPKTHESIIERQNEIRQTTPSTSREPKNTPLSLIKKSKPKVDTTQ